ncbi:MAG: CarD family transcriptional regulator [Clostridia bacterium]
MFNIGDKVVYPMHGAGTIESIEEKEMMGSSEDYYIIKMPMGDMKLMIPTNKVEEIGVREVSEKDVSEKVFDVLSKSKDPYVHDANWSKRYNTNVDKIKSGSILDVAEVVRELSHRHKERGLSIGEKKMLATAKDILLSEMVLSQNTSQEILDTKIEEVINESYEVGMQHEVDLKVVNSSDDITTRDV